jgi:glutamate racemase
MIGVFDSGLGGLTVVKELLRQLPGRGVLYFGDTARTPYGPKGPDVVKKFAVQDARFLIEHGADAIIVACNTVSALAIAEVRAAVDVPVFEVVTPAVARAAEVTRGRVGVIGTRGTIGSGIYASKMAAAAKGVKVFGQACPLFVPLVEEGWLRRPEAATIAKTYLRPLRSRHIDTLILGCTHYPFLRPQIAAAAGPGVRLVDPARETVAAFARFLAEEPALAAKLARAKAHRFFASDATPHAARIASRWLGTSITLERATLE